MGASRALERGLRGWCARKQAVTTHAEGVAAAAAMPQTSQAMAERRVLKRPVQQRCSGRLQPALRKPITGAEMQRPTSDLNEV